MRNRLIALVAVLVLLAAGVYLVAQRVLGGDLVRSEIEQQLSSRLGQPVHVRSTSVDVFPRVAVDLQEFAIGQPAVVQFGHVRLVTGLRGLISRRVENASVVVENGRVSWPLPFALSGGANGSQTGSSSLTIASVGQIQLRNITVATALPPITVDLDASLSGDRLDVTRVSARSDGNVVNASGAMTSLARLEGRFGLKGELTFAGYTARNFSSTLSLTPGGISLSPMRFAMFGGTFDGALSIDLRQSVPRAQLRGSVARLDVAEVVKNTGSTGGITGRLVGALSVAGAGTDGATLLRTARGTLRATVVDGTLPYIDIVRPVILAFGKPSGSTPSGSGSSFSSLAGNFTLADATLASQNLKLEARDFTASGSASLNIDSGAVESRLDLILSEELTAQAGTDLRRYAGQNGHVIVPATVGGTITHPTVFVDTAAAAKRALENEAKRKAGSLLKGIIKR